jgi:chromosome segregation protein
MHGVSAPARLLALRLQGFKSFAERTTVEFGPGISAIVGPNGSGKSNLADALRWALGEQGRALRSRKAEDVIFAGSERRAALGMADVTIVLDNADGLLPVEFSAIELGRRLYRSGENDYLLNRQRVRLRDLVDLLDGANLADNAFLFIGQGMVDQALALRPEERRPLFEEVAGVRRHERRRRRAEEQLAESEANLARVEDIVAELRPQARRLAAQAEQQASRADVGEELAEALLGAAHGRWHAAAARVATAAEGRDRATGALDEALAALTRAEEEASAIAADLAERATVERERRTAHESALTALTELRLREARLAGEVESVERDRQRLADERAAADAELALRRREVVAPVPARDVDLEAAAAEAERALSDALRQLGELRSATRARGEELEALRRAEAAREAEAETARRRLHEAERRLAEERERAAGVGARRAALEQRVDEAARVRQAAGEAETVAGTEREAARSAAELAEAARVSSAERASALGASLAELQARLAALESRVAEAEARGIARAARRRGGRRVDEDLVVDAAFRPAVEAALGEAARGYLVPPDTVAELTAERGILVLDGDPGAAGRAADDRRLRDRLAALGGGVLDAAITRDGIGAARRLLARAAWLPDLASCLAIRDVLPPGWIVVPRDGSAVVGDVVVAVGRPDATLERRAEAARVGSEVARIEAELADAQAAAAAAADRARAARAEADESRRREAAAETGRRRAEEAERVALRELETIARESAWHEAQVERLSAEAERLALAAASSAGEDSPADAIVPDGAPAGARDALATWEARVAELRDRRDRLAAELAGQDAARRDAEARLARTEAAIAGGEERIARADREAERLAERDLAQREELAALRAQLARAADAEQCARASLDAVVSADVDARARLGTAERAASAAREAVRVADERLRVADRTDLEARLGIDALREQLLVELAGLGELGLAVLGVDATAETGAVEAASDGSVASEAAALEAAIDRLAVTWSTTPPPDDAPSPGRLAVLRRRYHELGAANPFAVAEYEALRARLDGLDAQERDLRQAIARTRELIGELNRMIAAQFRATFRALEVAFDERFRQLFDGGFARLSLTDPDDLSATGVEIVARPPGKKAQPLAMLSGGERALTAVALLFAMLEVRPVPFCVLDEVDAALDEANVGRFSEALRRLADRTQFIVITHNRGTIESSDALYGVTVGDDSVSRIISLRLDEARSIAGQGRGDALVDAAAG